MSRTSWLDRLRRLVGAVRPPASPPPPATDAAPPEPPPRPPLEAAEAWLAELIARAAGGRDAERVASGEFWERIDLLVAEGHTRLAAEWLDKFADAAPPGAARDAVRARAVELREDRGELREALHHLEALVGSPGHAARAHFLLGEHHRREGDVAAALRHFEAVLAIDVDHPNARQRVELLRRRRGAAAAPPAAVDETIAGPEGRGAAVGARYRLLRELGRGATGAVYLARDVELERDVAIKLLYPHLHAAAQASARARFFEEARVAAALRHPNIVAILDLDERQKRIVMEFCGGGTLRDRLRAGPLPLAEALERHLELLSALQAAHRRGVVHRDLKPANLLFRRAPPSELVLADFGVAHLGGAPPPAAVAGARRADHAVGTLGYMAPEQRRGEQAAPRADLYSAAVILYECVVGAAPWDRDPAMRGVRLADDLALPPRAARALGDELAEAVSAHLGALGAADAAARPDTDEALAAARALLERAAFEDERRAFADDEAAVRGALERR